MLPVTKFFKESSVVTVLPNDTIIINSPIFLSPGERKRIMKEMKEVFPKNEVVILECLELGVVRKAEKDETT